MASRIRPAGDDTSRLSAGLGLLSVSAADRRNLSRRRLLPGRRSLPCRKSRSNSLHFERLGPGGCYLETTETFPTGTPLEIVVRTEDLKLRIHGKVQSTNPGFGMGVKFSPADDDHRKQVAATDCLCASGTQAVDLGRSFLDQATAKFQP